MKGIPYKTVELPPLMHAAIQRIRFGRAPCRRCS